MCTVTSVTFYENMFQTHANRIIVIIYNFNGQNCIKFFVMKNLDFEDEQNFV